MSSAEVISVITNDGRNIVVRSLFSLRAPLGGLAATNG
jgi:hypothetical protein